MQKNEFRRRMHWLEIVVIKVQSWHTSFVQIAKVWKCVLVYPKLSLTLAQSQICVNNVHLDHLHYVLCQDTMYTKVLCLPLHSWKI